MRLVHFDESGIANVQDEPRVVIAGTIIEPDRQYKQLEDHLALLAGRYVPPEKHSQFVAFHATDLFNCEGKIFSKKDGWTLEKTAPIIRKLLRIPWRYGLPIVYGTWNRAKYLPSDSGPQHKHRSQHVKEATERAYSIAFIQALLRVNLWMHRHARRDEVVMVVVEDNRDMRKLVSKALLMLRYPALITPEFRPYLPLDRIIDSVVFAQKMESSILQVPDILAYVIKRRIHNNRDPRDFWGLVAPLIEIHPTVENDPVVSALSNPPPGWRPIRFGQQWILSGEQFS